MNILFIGDVVGSPGRKALQEQLPYIKSNYNVDFIIVNGENSAAGLGINPVVAKEIFSYGVDAITLGNHTWSKSDIYNIISSEKRIIRPANVSSKWPGYGSAVYETSIKKIKIGLINLMGCVDMPPCNSPFEASDEILDNFKKDKDIKIIILDFHAEATSEKAAMFRYLDGRISAIIGTHTHVQTADEMISERGTFFITDVGMTGPYNSVIGMDCGVSVKRFVTRMPVPYKVGEGKYIFSAVIVDIDETDGKAKGVTRLRLLQK